MLVIATLIDVVKRTELNYGYLFVACDVRGWLLFVAVLFVVVDARRATDDSQFVVCCGSSWRFQLEPTYVPRLLVVY